MLYFLAQDCPGKSPRVPPGGTLAVYTQQVSVHILQLGKVRTNRMTKAYVVPPWQHFAAKRGSISKGDLKYR